MSRREGKLQSLWVPLSNAKASPPSSLVLQIEFHLSFVGSKRNRTVGSGVGKRKKSCHRDGKRRPLGREEGSSLSAGVSTNYLEPL